MFLPSQNILYSFNKLQKFNKNLKKVNLEGNLLLRERHVSNLDK